jgi:hypothetical protein
MGLGVLGELEAAGLVTLADKGYQGSSWAKIPYRGKGKSESQKQGHAGQLAKAIHVCRPVRHNQVGTGSLPTVKLISRRCPFQIPLATSSQIARRLAIQLLEQRTSVDRKRNSSNVSRFV